jgi:hypothetical protein
MEKEANYALEEYRMLKSETKSYTDQSFRDFQIFVTILAIFFAVVGAKFANRNESRSNSETYIKSKPAVPANPKENLNTASKAESVLSPVSFLITQLALYVFLIIQLMRASYVLKVRKHLVELENTLNDFLSPENKRLGFSWESDYVPREISRINSLGTQIQIVIILTYGGIFFYLCWALIDSAESFSLFLYLCLFLLAIEWIFLFHCARVLIIQSIKSVDRGKEQLFKKYSVFRKPRNI